MGEEWNVQPLPVSGRPLPVDDPAAFKVACFGRPVSREDLERSIGNPFEVS